MSKNQRTHLSLLLERLGGVLIASSECGLPTTLLYTFSKRGYVTREHYHDFMAYLKDKGVSLSEQQQKALLTNKWVGVSNQFTFTVKENDKTSKAA